MNAPFVGQSVERKEDYRFLTGAGQYTDDVVLPGQTYAYFLRSAHAHATIRGINTTRARSAPGVVGIFTGEDLAAAKVGGLPCGWLITDVNGQPMKEPPHPPLAQGKVRYVGDHVAVVIAETQHQAKDAAELIEVDYEVLPAIVNAADARKPGAAVVHDAASDNTCYVWAIGDKGAVDQAFPPRTTSPCSSSSIIASYPTPSNRAPQWRIIRGPTTPTPCTSRTRIRTSSGCS